MTTALAKFEIVAYDNTQKAFAGVHKNLDKLNRAFIGMKTALLSVAGVAGFGEILRGSLEVADNIQAISQRLGSSTEALSQYRHVAKQSNVDFEVLVKTWDRMRRNITLAAAGVGPAKQFLKNLGVDAKEFARLKPEEQFERLTEKLNGLKNANERATYATGIMGKTATQVMSIMHGGRAAIQALREEADRMGLTLTTEAVDKMAAANDQVDKVQMAFGGLGLIIAQELSPAIMKAGEAFLQAIKWIRDHADALRDIAKLLMGGGVLFAGLRLLPTLLSTAAAAFITAARGVAMFIAAFQMYPILALNTALFGTPIAAVAAAGALGKVKIAMAGLAAATLGWGIGTWLYNNFYQARVAGLAFVGALLKGWENLKYGFNVAWLAISTAFTAKLDMMKDAFAGFLSFVANGLSKLPFAGGAADSLGQFVTGLKSSGSATSDFKTRLAELTQQHTQAKAKIDENITSLVAYEMNIGRTNKATKENKQQNEETALSLGNLSNAREKANKLLEEAKRLTEEMRTPHEVYRDNINQVTQMLDKGYVSQETFNRALKKYKKDLEDATGVTEALKKQKDAYEEHIKEVTDIFKDGLFAFMDEGFNGMVKSFENALKKMAAEAASQEISKMLFGNAGKGSEGGSLFSFLGGFLGGGSSSGGGGGGGIGSFFSSIFGGARAEGGPVQLGKSYLVGENEPELFTPSTSGHITPLSQLAGAGNTTVVINNNIQTPNAESFRRAEGNLTARMKMQLDRAGKRNL